MSGPCRPSRRAVRALGHPGELHVLGSVPGQPPSLPSPLRAVAPPQALSPCPVWGWAQPAGSSGRSSGEQLPRGREETHCCGHEPLGAFFTLALAFLARQKRETSPSVGTSLTLCSFTKAAHWADTGTALGTGGHEASSGVPQTEVKPE